MTDDAPSLLPVPTQAGLVACSNLPLGGGRSTTFLSASFLCCGIRAGSRLLFSKAGSRCGRARRRLFNPERHETSCLFLPLLCDRRRGRWRGRRERSENRQSCNCFSLLLLLVPSACLAPFLSLCHSLSICICVSLPLPPSLIHSQPPLLIFHL